MGHVESIVEAVKALQSSELAEFRCWFAKFDAPAWDAQIELDASVGRWDSLAAEALADFRTGPSHEL